MIIKRYLMVKIKTSITITPLAKKLLSILAEKHGMNRSAMLELLIREAAKVDEIGVDEIISDGWKTKEQDEYQ